MAAEPVPGDVRDFILRHIDSVAQLEALLLLRGNPEETWDVGTVARRLYADEQQVADALSQLCGDGLLSDQDGIYRYNCRTEEFRLSVDRLAAFHSTHLIEVTNIIHAKPRRIRQFADAFKFQRGR